MLCNSIGYSFLVNMEAVSHDGFFFVEDSVTIRAGRGKRVMSNGRIFEGNVKFVKYVTKSSTLTAHEVE